MLDDTNTGSLRRTTGRVNADATDTAESPDRIQFAIPAIDPGYNATTGVWTIAPAAALSTITQPVVIRRYSQAGAGPNTLARGDYAVLKIRLDGTDAGPGADGLKLGSGDVAVSGLAVTGFGYGIHVAGLGDDLIVGNFVGVDPSGIAEAGNATAGIFIDSSGSKARGVRRVSSGPLPRKTDFAESLLGPVIRLSSNIDLDQ